MMGLKFLIIAISAALFWFGGYKWHNARRFIMPFFLTFFALFFTHWSLICLTMLSSIGAFCLGYGDKSPLRHCFGDGWARGIWGLLGAFCLSLGLFLGGHLSLFLLISYLAVNFTLENALKKLPQVIGDPIIGLGFSSIILLLR